LNQNKLWNKLVQSSWEKSLKTPDPPPIWVHPEVYLVEKMFASQVCSVTNFIRILRAFSANFSHLKWVHSQKNSALKNDKNNKKRQRIWGIFNEIARWNTQRFMTSHTVCCLSLTCHMNETTPRSYLKGIFFTFFIRMKLKKQMRKKIKWNNFLKYAVWIQIVYSYFPPLPPRQVCIDLSTKSNKSWLLTFLYSTSISSQTQHLLTMVHRVRHSA